MTARNRRGLALLTSAVLATVLVWSLTMPRFGIAGNLGYTWANALQVANPEYQIYHRGSVDTSREAFSATTTAELDSHANAVNLAVPRQILHISQSILGATTFPAMPRSPISAYLKTFGGGEGENLEQKQEAIRQAKLLPSRQQVLVLVELVKPTREESLERIRPFDNAEWKRFFLSKVQQQSGKPVYWWPGWNGCSAMNVPSNDCADRSITDDFRQWVNNFTEKDEVNLAKIDLDLSQLRAVAAEGLIYGFMDTRTGGQALLELLASPEVRTVKIMEMIPESEE